METKPCPSCERGTLEPKGQRGRFFPLRGFGELELPEDVLLPTCDFCGKIVLSPKFASAFDEGMKSAHDERVAQIISESLRDLTSEAIGQQDLERLLGLSQGYVSKLKGGKESSRVMAGLLGLLAADPRRLKELKELWAGGKRSSATRSIRS